MFQNLSTNVRQCLNNKEHKDSMKILIKEAKGHGVSAEEKQKAMKDINEIKATKEKMKEERQATKEQMKEERQATKENMKEERQATKENMKEERQATKDKKEKKIS